MKRQECEQLTLFQEASPASRSPLPGSEEARRMTVTSGLKCLELYQNSGQIGSLVRMLLGSSIWRSTRCALTWKTKVTPCKRLLFRLVPSTRRTEGTDARLSGVERWKENITGEDGEPILWKTPIASDSANREFYHNSRGEPNLSGMVKLFPNTDSVRCDMRGSSGQGVYGDAPCNGTDSGGEDMAYSDSNRLEKPGMQGLQEKSGISITDNGWRTTEPRLGGVVDGFSDWMDRGMSKPGFWMDEPDVPRITNKKEHRKDRIQCLGNAVVPQQFYPVFKAIADMEMLEAMKDADD